MLSRVRPHCRAAHRRGVAGRSLSMPSPDMATSERAACQIKGGNMTQRREGIMKLGVGMAVVTGVVLAAVVQAAGGLSRQSPGTLRVCVQQSGSAQNIGDLNVNLRGCKGQRYTLPLGTPLPGATGPAGAVGPQGSPGPHGPAGPKGDTGPKGDMGPKGDTGPHGKTGPQGHPGATGGRGPAGSPGGTGPKGDTGAIGPEGASGPQGPGRKGRPVRPVRQASTGVGTFSS
jgi:Collagen triple helix repeat (20 copies)